LTGSIFIRFFTPQRGGLNPEHSLCPKVALENVVAPIASQPPSPLWGGLGSGIEIAEYRFSGMLLMTSPAYDPNNVFAKIIRGEIPSIKVFENDNVLAIMDVMPQADGHVLIIPKAPCRNLLDADPVVLATLLPVVQTMAIAVKDAFDADGVSIFQYNEAAGGQSVFHLHFHVVPRHEGKPTRPHTGKMEDGAVLKANAEKILGAFS